MSLSVLDQNTNNNSALNNQPAGDPLATLVGEGKKFKTVEELARGKIESDAFIAKLQEETAQLRNELATRVSVEEQIAKLSTGGVTTPTNPLGNQSQSVLDEKAVDDLLARKLSEREAATRAQANQSAVDSAIMKAFGGDVERARRAVAEAEASMGVRVADLAATSPQAALRILGIGQSTGGGYVSENGTRSTAVPSNIGEATRNKAYYDKLKSEMGTTKFLMDTRLQNQMHKDALSMGDTFYQR